MLKNYIRHSIVTDVETTLEKIKQIIDEGGDSLRLNGVDVHINRKKLRAFAEKGYHCVSCGAKASYMAIEKHSIEGNRWIFHLYITTDNCKERLLTRDHIYPISKGGKGDITNIQPMCSVCNAKKSDNLNYKVNFTNE